MANDAQLGMQVGFWHLDGSHMDDDFAFSELRTREEWEARRREWEEFTEKFNREWEERQQRERLTGVEPVERPMDSNKPTS
jgi:primase-polymerase (primpol)-like protein